MTRFQYTIGILFMALVLFVLSECRAECPDKHPIYCHIMEISPKLNKKLAFEISNKISKYSRKYKIDARLFTAIIRQESNFKLNAKGCHWGLDENYKKMKVCSDFGMTQIYFKTAKGYGFDIERVTKDLDYSIHCGIIVLKDFKKRYSKREKDWWSRYNARSKDKREIYKTLVERYL